MSFDMLRRVFVYKFIYVLFSGKTILIYSEGLLWIYEMVLENFVFAHSPFMFFAPPGTR